MKRKLIIILSLLATVSCDKWSLDSSDTIRCTATIENTDSTKGKPLNSDSLNIKNNVFLMDALLESSRKSGVPAHYLTKAEMTFKSGYWENDDCKWANLVWTNFWAVYPKIDTCRGDLTWTAVDPSAITDAEEKTATFTYDMTSFKANKHAVDSTKDILVAYARSRRNVDEATGGNLKFKFRHALSGICFKRGHIDTGYNITEVTIGGIHLKGTCTLVGSTVSLKDTLTIDWAGTDTPTATDTLTQKISATSVAEGSLITGDNMMYVIPQTMTASTTISAVIHDTVADTTGTRSVALVGYSWKPGKRYAYTLSFYKDLNELVISVDEYNIVKNGTWTD